MISNAIHSALEREVVGQPGAVLNVVRGVTRLLSGLTPRERTLCAYMLMGPTGTGKTHLVHSLTRLLHGDARRLVVADCSQFMSGDPWMAFVAQLAPLFAPRGADPPWARLAAPPLSVILIEYLERGSEQLFRGLAAVLESGQLVLPGGRPGSLGNCLVFLTTGLCSREILDESPRIGFTGAQDEQEDAGRDRIYDLCLERAEKHFGANLVARLDRLIILHRLEPEHLAGILERRTARLNQWLAPRGFQVELQPAAGEFLLERGRRNLKAGSRDLVRACQTFVEFPVADLMISQQIPAGGHVVVDRRPGEEHLHFSVCAPPAADGLAPSLLSQIPIG